MFSEAVKIEGGDLLAQVFLELGFIIPTFSIVRSICG
ncbi:MAG: hypothetical protein ACI9XB_004060 [Gammaproteobacteria bacterium]|jgi:hypothetical protein